MARRRSQGTAAPRRRQSQPPANKAMPDSSRGVCPAFFRPVRAGILLPSPARDRPCPMPVWRPLSPPPPRANLRRVLLPSRALLHRLLSHGAAARPRQRMVPHAADRSPSPYLRLGRQNRAKQWKKQAAVFSKRGGRQRQSRRGFPFLYAVCACAGCPAHRNPGGRTKPKPRRRPSKGGAGAGAISRRTQ